MREQSRFASLRGKARQWLSDEIDDLDELPDFLAANDNHSLDHDGWMPIAPRKRFVRVSDLASAQRRLRKRSA